MRRLEPGPFVMLRAGIRGPPGQTRRGRQTDFQKMTGWTGLDQGSSGTPLLHPAHPELRYPVRPGTPGQPPARFGQRKLGHFIIIENPHQREWHIFPVPLGAGRGRGSSWRGLWVNDIRVCIDGRGTRPRPAPPAAPCRSLCARGPRGPSEPLPPRHRGPSTCVRSKGVSTSVPRTGRICRVNG